MFWLPMSVIDKMDTARKRFFWHGGNLKKKYHLVKWIKITKPKNNGVLAFESPSLVLVINETKLLMSCVKCFELDISNTCDEGVCGKEWWPQDHKEMVHGHEMTIMVEMHII
jgi:hypothetical protein